MAHVVQTSDRKGGMDIMIFETTLFNVHILININDFYAYENWLTDIVDECFEPLYVDVNKYISEGYIEWI